MSLLLSLIWTIPKLGASRRRPQPKNSGSPTLLYYTHFTSRCNVNTFVICQKSSVVQELSPDKLEAEAPQQPLRPLHPGMLSAALQGTLPPSHQPPTPPRTPQVVRNQRDDYHSGNTQGHLSKHQEPASPLSMLPKMPSLLSMAALQQQMLGKPPGKTFQQQKFLPSAISENFPLFPSIFAQNHDLMGRVTCGPAHE